MIQVNNLSKHTTEQRIKIDTLEIKRQLWLSKQ
jgi:hypothetical protein